MNGDYTPENCKWSLNKEQSNNKRTNIFIEYNGIKLTLKQWSEKLGYEYKLFHRKIRYNNISIEELIKNKL